jgi:hypothetical protein
MVTVVSVAAGKPDSAPAAIVMDDPALRDLVSEKILSLRRMTRALPLNFLKEGDRNQPRDACPTPSAVRRPTS